MVTILARAILSLITTQVVTDIGKVRLIDLEYSGPNYAAFDIGNLFNEYEDYDDNDHDDNKKLQLLITVQYSTVHNAYIEQFKFLRVVCA